MESRLVLILLLVSSMAVLTGCLGFNDNSSDSGLAGPQTLSGDEVEQRLGFTQVTTFESFTITAEFSTSNQSQNATLISFDQQVDSSTDRGLSRTQGFINSTTYTTENTTYSRTEPLFGSGNATYSKATPPYNGTLSPVGPGSVDVNNQEIGLLRNQSYNRTTETVFNEKDVIVYETTQEGNFTEDVSGAGTANASFDTVEITLYLNPASELISYYSFVYSGTNTNTGERITATVGGQLRDINATSVSPPEWLDEAKNNTN